MHDSGSYTLIRNSHRGLRKVHESPMNFSTGDRKYSVRMWEVRKGNPNAVRGIHLLKPQCTLAVWCWWEIYEPKHTETISYYCSPLMSESLCEVVFNENCMAMKMTNASPARIFCQSGLLEYVKFVVRKVKSRSNSVFTETVTHVQILHLKRLKHEE